MQTPINPPGFPVSPAYSHAVETRGTQRMLFVSGQVGVGPDGNVPSGIAAQAQAAVANLNAVLAAAGMTNENIVKTTIFLTDPANMQGFIEAAGPTLPQPPPAATLLIVKGLASPELLVEIEAIAVE